MTTPGPSVSFPNLTTGSYKKTSEFDVTYNCIAWAAEDSTRWWWPLPQKPYYWPIPQMGVTRQNFIDAFATLGYIVANALDPSLQSDLEKVALFEDSAGKPTHAARQLPSGTWTSKLGKEIDIEHIAVAGVEGPEYGTVAVILVRPSTQPSRP